jgi:ribonuclease HI
LGKKSASNKFYAYYIVDQDSRGVVQSWDDCESATHGHHARYKGFGTREDAVAWLDGGAVYADRKANKKALQVELPENAIFFDSGTGRGLGTEVNVTDRDGVPMAFKVAPPEHITEHGTVMLSPGRTNNYGELMGCYLAMKLAMSTGQKLVCGDSQLVLDFWSRGRVNADTAAKDADLALLVSKTAQLRKMFEKAGGKLQHVPGGINPADLGFHRD